MCAVWADDWNPGTYSRLSGFEIYVGNGDTWDHADNKQCGETHGATSSNQKITKDCGVLHGRYVHLVIPDNGNYPGKKDPSCSQHPFLDF